MRMLLYILAAIAVYVLVVYFGHPINGYLASIKHRDDGVAATAQPVDIGALEDRFSRTHARIIPLLVSNPTFSRIRVAMIHTGIAPDATVNLEYDTISAVGAPGHSPGSLFTNHPLSDWSDFLPILLTHQCAYAPISLVKNDNFRKNAEAMNNQAVLICPIISDKNQLIGGLFATWDDINTVPSDLSVAKRSMMGIADQLGKN